VNPDVFVGASTITLVKQDVVGYTKSIAKTLSIPETMQGVPGKIFFPQFKIFTVDSFVERRARWVVDIFKLAQ
jgi:hypothetical protein